MAQTWPRIAMPTTRMKIQATRASFRSPRTPAEDVFSDEACANVLKKTRGALPARQNLRAVYWAWVRKRLRLASVSLLNRAIVFRPSLASFSLFYRASPEHVLARWFGKKTSRLQTDASLVCFWLISKSRSLPLSQRLDGFVDSGRARATALAFKMRANPNWSLLHRRWRDTARRSTKA